MRPSRDEQRVAPASNEPAPLLDERAAARFFGVSERCLRTWRAAGAVPHVRLGVSERTVRYRRADLERFVAERVRGGAA